jgi:hypothetical protein
MTTVSSTVRFLPVLHHSFSVLPFSKLSRLREAPRARGARATARGRRWLDEIVSGSVIGVEQIAVRQKMQYASGQYDDFARVPRTGSRQSSGRRLPAARH